MAYHSKSKTDQYLQMFPKLEKWVNHCPICGARGRKPEMPETIGEGMAAHNLRQMLPVLEMGESGFCLTCARVYQKRSHL